MEEGMEESKEKVLEEKERHDRIVAEEERYAGMSSGDENMSDRKNGSPFERKQGFDRYVRFSSRIQHSTTDVYCMI